MSHKNSWGCVWAKLAAAEIGVSSGVWPRL